MAIAYKIKKKFRENDEAIYFVAIPKRDCVTWKLLAELNNGFLDD